jgi:hypothetical protein
VQSYSKKRLTQEQKQELLEDSTHAACVLADVRDLLHEYPWLQRRGAEAVCRMLKMTRGLFVSEFDAAVALEALRDENGEVLS